MDKITGVKVENVTCTGANTEYSYLMPQNTRAFSFQIRGGAAKIAFVTATSGTKYFSLASGAIYTIDGLNLDNFTIYFQTPTAGAVAEIITWKQ